MQLELSPSVVKAETTVRISPSVDRDIVQTVQIVEDQKEEGISSMFPETVYDKLPTFIYEMCTKFSDKRERDVFLLGALTTLSNIFSNVTGRYDNYTYGTNIYSLIIAPPASGKGVLTFTKNLCNTLHNSAIANDSERNIIIEEGIKNMLNEEAATTPTAPLLPYFMPANISVAAMYEHLELTGGKAVMCEFEIDTMVNSTKQGWGDYSAILRNAFQHEPISYRRKTGGILIEINNPKISVLLSGTPSQAKNLIKSSENGLFSRFAIYNYKSVSSWRNVAPKKDSNLSEYFEEESLRILNMCRFMEMNPTVFHLNSSQWEIFNNHFEKLHNKTQHLVSEEAVSVVRRLAVITFRIAMLMTAIQKATEYCTIRNVLCKKNFLEAALEMSEILLEHSLTFFNTLPGQSAKLTVDQLRFYNALPKGVVFTRSEAVSLCESFLSKSGIDKFLAKLSKASLIEQIKFGEYLKK